LRGAWVLAARPAEAAEAQPILDVLAHNPALTVLTPEPLSKEATGREVAAALGGKPAQKFVTACARASGGNPFLLAELLRGLTDVAPSVANAPLVARQTSKTVSRAALARLRRLSPDAQSLPRAPVTLAEPAHPPLAAGLAGLAATTASHAAEALEHAAILAPGAPGGSDPPEDFTAPRGLAGPPATQGGSGVGGSYLRGRY